jgi:hypothetical protein
MPRNLTPGGGHADRLLRRAHPAAPGGRPVATERRSQNLVLPASPMGAVAPLHERVTGVALVTHRELGRGRHRHQPRCRHRSCASHTATRRGPRRRRAEHDSRRSPRPGECCRARWWQMRPLVSDQDRRKVTIHRTQAASSRAPARSAAVAGYRASRSTRVGPHSRMVAAV